MRTVPVNLPLKPRYPKSLTKAGRSSLQPSASQSTAEPSSPATEVNVPHSCTVRSPVGTDLESAAAKNTAAETIRAKAATRASRIVDFIGVVPIEAPASRRDFVLHWPAAVLLIGLDARVAGFLPPHYLLPLISIDEAVLWSFRAIRYASRRIGTSAHMQSYPRRTAAIVRVSTFTRSRK